ncbi:MAG: hypothetical protein KZQ74_00920 [gamma proteobacterium symbiont of Bathyaustriella thionipta]|nr:hypothetical protein [gamma proteobacterium symbiont of Bathyaustriella thionipta]MCU7951589.1 hypothetical protein [gamma proteobacterium symbiont of Bathyaustriella thionipta]MCU7958191.1 hypothetical protein [gamma proteobacterium symbiont of Bathyaustriella thionipta]MCU7965771.1 hypothetical protein [gamma proteobacterium symbiont of Bathyaustriella thionipta]
MFYISQEDLHPSRTILHHIKQPWSWQKKHQAYFFCDDPQCEVVYFGQDDSIIKTTALRTPVGLKEKKKDSLLCYCFGISFSDAQQNPEIKQFVFEQTKRNVCACETHNPSGRCCLKDFPKE